MCIKSTSNNNNDNDNDNDNNNKLYLYSVYIINCYRRFTILREMY